MVDARYQVLATTTCGVFFILILLPVFQYGAFVAAETSSVQQQQQQAVAGRARHRHGAVNRSTSAGDVIGSPSKDHRIGSSSSPSAQQLLLPRRNIIRGEREAAVITRLPQMKTEVCRAERLEQTISVRGCVQRSVVNRYCYGQCNSFFIPRSARSAGRSSSKSEPGGGSAGSSRRRHRSGGARSLIADGSTSSSSSVDALDVTTVDDPARPLSWSAFRSCSFCRPKRVEWVTVVLSCPKRRPSYRRRRVQIVKECACTALTLD